MKRKLLNILKILKPKNKKQQGAVAVEFALLLPLLVMIVFGIFQFGIAFNNWIIISNAAREGARLASVNGSLSAADINIIKSYAPSGDIVSVVAYCDFGTGKGKPVRVEVVGKVLDLSIPFVPSPPGGNAISLKSAATMRLEK